MLSLKCEVTFPPNLLHAFNDWVFGIFKKEKIEGSLQK
jgi:hypothetical protein